uniref:Uncharacterized protein n=1 Tax=Rhizophora mucronata TaxID=61149 RepID=A0A2P2Q0R6_RHIMU
MIGAVKIGVQYLIIICILF